MKSQTPCRVKSRQEDWSSGAPARKKRTQYSRPAVRRRDRRRADGMRDARKVPASMIGAVPIGGWHIVLHRDTVAQPARPWRRCAWR